MGNKESLFKTTVISNGERRIEIKNSRVKWHNAGALKRNILAEQESSARTLRIIAGVKRM